MEFDRNTVHRCRDATYCKNGAQCFQDDPYCPTAAVCLCSECHYGSRCQFTTKEMSLSLDAVLGYHILPNISLTH